MQYQNNSLKIQEEQEKIIKKLDRIQQDITISQRQQPSTSQPIITHPPEVDISNISDIKDLIREVLDKVKDIPIILKEVKTIPKDTQLPEIPTPINYTSTLNNLKDKIDGAWSDIKLVIRELVFNKNDNNTKHDNIIRNIRETKNEIAKINPEAFKGIDFSSIKGSLNLPSSSQGETESDTFIIYDPPHSFIEEILDKRKTI